MKNKTLYGVICAIGSMMIGFFANNLEKIYGSILFSVGVVMLVISIVKISK